MIPDGYKIKFLRECKFPDLDEIERRQNPSGDPEWDKRYSSLLKYTQDIEALSPTDLECEYLTATRQHQLKIEELQEREDQSRSFSKPGAEAEYSFWFRQEKWSADEAAALLLGKSPSSIRLDEIENIAGRSPFARKYLRLRKSIQERYNADNENGSLPPSKVLIWAREFSIEIPTELEEISSPGPVFDPRERATLLKLVIAMAKGRYGYDPEQSRGKAAAEIASDLDQIGLTLDTDTVRKWLRRAAKLLPNKPPNKKL